MNCERKCYKCGDTWRLSMTDFHDYSGDPIMDICSDCQERRERKDQIAAKTLELLESIQSWINTHSTK